MFGPLLLSGIAAVLGGTYAIKATYNDEDLTPKVAGVSLDTLMTGVGLAAAFLFSGPIASIGAGLGVAGLLSAFNRGQLSTGFAVEKLNQVAAAVQQAPAVTDRAPPLAEQAAVAKKAAAPEPEDGRFWQRLFANFAV